MEHKIKNLISKLEAENAKRKDWLKHLPDHAPYIRDRIVRKCNYTCEIIQQLKNCL